MQFAHGAIFQDGRHQLSGSNISVAVQRRMDFLVSSYQTRLKSLTNMKKVLGETQTLHPGCNKVDPRIFAPPQTPFPGAQDGQNLISWRWSLPLPTNTVWSGSMHAISSYHGNRPNHKQTGPITIHCAASWRTV